MRFGLREAVFLLVLLGMPLAAWWFEFRDNNQRIQQIEDEIADDREKLRQLEQATQSVDDLGQEIERLTKAIEMFEEKLPAEEEVDVILRQITNVADRHDLDARSVRARKPVESARYSERPLEMVISGDFDGFYAFLLDLERLSRITRVPEMQLRKLRQKGDGQMEAKFILKIFFEPKAGDSDNNDRSA